MLIQILRKSIIYRLSSTTTIHNFKNSIRYTFIKSAVLECFLNRNSNNKYGIETMEI